MKLFTLLRNLFTCDYIGDLSQHRQHTIMYEDLCK